MKENIPVETEFCIIGDASLALANESSDRCSVAFGVRCGCGAIDDCMIDDCMILVQNFKVIKKLVLYIFDFELTSPGIKDQLDQVDFDTSPSFVPSS